MRHYITLCEAAVPGGATFWFHPDGRVIPASDHGDAVIQNPSRFDIDYRIQEQMEDAFPEGGDEDEAPSNSDNIPSELWGGAGGWYRNDAWETLAMNRGWVRIGEATSISAAYVSSSTAEAVWRAVNYLVQHGGMADAVEIEIARPEHQVFTTLTGDAVKQFLRGGPKRADAFLRE
jgi:hypothetical protein